MQNSHRVHYTSVYVPRAAVVVSQTGSRNLHAGIAHRTPEDRVFILHLAWDCDLRNGEADEATGRAEKHDPLRIVFPWPIFVIPDVADKAELDLVAGLCRRFYEAAENREISYCLGHFPDSTAYIDDRGIFRSTDLRIGLTCVSLVLQIFKKAKIPLVHVESWPIGREKDTRDQTSLLRVMEDQFNYYRQTGKRTTITREKIDFNREQVGKRRVAPEEVAAACLESRENLPADFEACEEHGREVANLLGRLRRSDETRVPLFFVP